MNDPRPVILTKDPITTWANKVNEGIGQNRVVQSPDFVGHQTSDGLILKLKSRHKTPPNTFRYRGEYDANAAYTVNDVVRVLPDVNYSDTDGNLVPATPGVWICVVNVPSQTFTDALTDAVDSGTLAKYRRYLRSDLITYYPQWPEPNDIAKATDSIDDANGRYWDLISLLPTKQSVCVNGVAKTFYVDSYEYDTSTGDT